MTAEQRSGTVTILFTDLVGSTELMQRLGDDQAEELRRVHFQLLREAMAAHGGREVKTIGDSFMVAFDSAVDAVGCAVTMQQAVRRHNDDQQPAMRLHVRIGLHVGEPVREEQDYFGTPVVIARRLCDSARGGEIRASGLVRELVGSRGGFTFFNLGPLTLKGISDPLAAYQVIWEPAAVSAQKRTPIAPWAIAGGALAAGGMAAVIGVLLFAGGGDDEGNVQGADGTPTADVPGAAVSPAEIAFVSDRGGKLGIHFVNGDGSGLSSLPDIPGFDADLAWSPDGSRIAFTVKQGGGAQASTTGGAQPSATAAGGGGGGRRRRRRRRRASHPNAGCPSAGHACVIGKPRHLRRQRRRLRSHPPHGPHGGGHRADMVAGRQPHRFHLATRRQPGESM